MPNRLINARSPYLRKSAHQPVDWYEWSEEAFERARKEDKPILMSIGGVWCHWCHVMAHESFEKPEIARIINENFIPIKVDRDERPDIDRRHQEVVMALTGSGGWPLTVFLTPEGEAFFGGTYFPPEDRWGRPGFKSLLLRIAQLWKEDRDKILSSAMHITQSIRDYYSRSYKDFAGEELLSRGISALLASLDYQKGGMAGAPKFHHAKALELLIIHAYFTNNEAISKAVELSSDAMAKGGVYDHLLGGFFRYSTDEDWLVPHFEKMLYDNAELLELYSIAYRVWKKELYSYIARGIVEYYKLYGADPKGGFYASQDADIGLLDEGGYYTFTYEELKDILSPEEMSLATLYFGITPKGHMHGGKNVLHINMTEEEVSLQTDRSLEEVKGLIQSIRQKLTSLREKRQTPYIDKTLYTGWNGLMLTGMCEYYKTFGDRWAYEFSVKTADRLLKEFYKEGGLLHTEGVEGFSEDYIFLARGLLSLYEITQDKAYLSTSKELTDRAIQLFWDGQSWGFVDAPPKGVGLLSVKNRPLQDTPTQSVNGSAVYTLLLLYSLTGEEKYMEYAEKTLQAFAGFVRDVPMVSHSYLIGLYAFLKGIYKVETKDYFDELLRAYRPFKFLLHSDVKGAVVCEGNTCRVFEDLKGLV